MHTPDRENSSFITPPSNASGMPGGAASCPSLLELAAYCDGNASEDEAHAMEFHLSRCSSCLELARDYRESPTEEEAAMRFIPSHVLTNAMALVGVETEAIVPPRWGWPVWNSWIRRGAALAASVAIGVVGHSIGAAMSDSRQAVAEGANNEMLFGMIDSSSQGESVSELFALSLGTGSGATTGGEATQ